MGAPKAITATAHKLARLLYSMLKHGTAYVRQGMDEYAPQSRDRTVKNLTRRAKTLEYKQLPENLRRNVLPVKLINRSLLMRHEHLAGALVELSEMVKTSSRTNGVLHHAPEAFDGVEVMSAVSG